MSHKQTSTVDDTGRMEHENGIPISRRSALRGTVGAGLFGLVGLPAMAGVASASIPTVASDWQVSGGNVTNSATGSGVDFAWTSNGKAETTVESTGEVTLYYDASVSGLAGQIYTSGTSSGITFARDGQPGSGQVTVDVTAGSTFTVNANGVFGIESAHLTLSTTPLNGPTNSLPEADLSAPMSAVQGQPITLDASGSSDPDGDALTFAWNLNDDGTYDDATGATIQHSFATAGVQTVSVEVSDGTDTDTADATIEVAHYAPLDVKPGSDDNPVNPKSKGVLPVAILNTDDFDPTAVVVESLVLSVTESGDGASPAKGGQFEDVDGDGDDDLVVHFANADLDLDSETSILYLSGQMADGLSLVGSDEVTAVGNGKGNNSNGNGKGRGR